VRRLARIRVVLSLLLFVATVVLWVRSYFVADRWGYQQIQRFPLGAEHTTRWISTDAGRLEFLYSYLFYSDVFMITTGGDPILTPSKSFFHWSNAKKPISDWGIRPHPTPDLVVTHRFLGFEYKVVNPTPRTRDFLRTVSLSMPLWFVALCSGTPPLLAWRRYRRRKRSANQNRCPSCGYDLRATPERCPECGTIPAR